MGLKSKKVCFFWIVLPIDLAKSLDYNFPMKKDLSILLVLSVVCFVVVSATRVVLLN